VGKLHRLNENAYGITRLFHLSNVGVNAGFIVTKNSIIHIDAGMTVADGKSLLVQSSKEAKKKENLFLILTHHHSDHIFGMRVFREAGAKVIAHENVRKFLSHRTLPLFQNSLTTYRPFIIRLMVRKLSYTKEKAEEILGDVKLFLPDKTFTEDTSLQIDGDSILLLHTPGHVPSEITVYHPKSKTLFAGDTIYEGMPLNTKFGGQKEWRMWIQSLEKLDELDIETIVPGHGRICGRDEIQRNITYLEDLLNKQ